MPDLITLSESPLNAETPLDRLRAAFITPQPDFYIRSHGDIPHLDGQNYVLGVGGLVTRPLRLSLPELRGGFAERTVLATLQCAGNRRSELHAVQPVSGDPWSAGAIGNAAWTGVALADVLRAAGAGTGRSLHVAFEAADRLGGSDCFGASIPMAKAVDPDVLLAYAMNGETLTTEHGFPLRVVVPGFAGVRCVKWLTRIAVSREPSPSPVQRHDYKLFPPETSQETADWSAGTTINEMPLTSAICIPSDRRAIAAGPTAVSGYAYAPGPGVAKVEISADGGQSWQEAELARHPAARWCWTFWSTTVNLDRGMYELAVRAWDAAGRTQPALPAEVWNFKGYLCTAWHRIGVHAT